MPAAEKEVAALHRLVLDIDPHLYARTSYGMPAYEANREVPVLL